MGDLRQLKKIVDNKQSRYPTGLYEYLERELMAVKEMLLSRAEQLELDGRYRDVEHIYNQLYNYSELQIEDMDSHSSQKFTALYERLGKFSEMEADQESLLRYAIDYDKPENEVALESEKLYRMYALFHDRIRVILDQRGRDPAASANLARLAVFHRMVALDINAFCDLFVISPRIGLPKLALHLATKAGATYLTGMLLKNAVSDINTKDESGNTALHVAVGWCQCRSVEIILDHDADADVVNKKGDTPLQLALSQTPEPVTDTIKVLLAHGANVNVVDSNEGTPLLQAARFGHADIVHLLIHNSADVDHQDCNGKTALHAALESGKGTVEQLVSALVKAKSNIEAKDSDGRTALGTALKLGMLAVSRQLIGHGADVDAERRGESLLHYVVRKKNGPAVELLLQNGAGLHRRNDYGETPLHIAVRTGYDPAVKALLDHAADIEAMDMGGHNSLHISVAAGKESIVELLFERGAKIPPSQYGTNKLLRSGICTGNVSIIELLIKHGARIPPWHYGTDDLLRLAIYERNLSIVRLLLKAGADVNSQDLFGNTPLHEAAKSDARSCLQIIILLVENGASLYAANKYWNTPLHIAAFLRLPKTMKQLLGTQTVNQAHRNLTFLNVEEKSVYDLFSIGFPSDQTVPDFDAWLEVQHMIDNLLLRNLPDPLNLINEAF